MSEKIQRQHLVRKAVLYVRQSSAYQVSHHVESQALQYAMQGRLPQLGWREIEVVDDDLGRSAAGMVTRTGFERMVAEVCLGKVGAVAAREVSRFARNNRDWQQLIEVCRVVETVLIDHDTVYAPRHSNDRLLLRPKGSLNEYELDLLRQRSVDARRAKACRGELIVASPAGYLNPHFRARREKARCLLQVKVLPGELSVRPGSYRGGEEGNRIAEALGTSAHRGWVCEPTGRNTCEARAGLESDVVSADLPRKQGRPPDHAGVTDR